MKTFYRFLAIAAIVFGILGIVLAMVSVISIWQIYNPLTTSLDKLLLTAEKGLEVVDKGLSVVDPLVGLLANSMLEIQETGDELSAQIQDSSPLIDGLSYLLGEDIEPKVEQASASLIQVRDAAEQVNAISQTVSALPFLDLQGISDVTQGFVDLMEEIDQGVKDIRSGVENLKQGISQEVIKPIQDRAAVVEDELNGLQTEIQATHVEVQNLYTFITVLRPRIPAILGIIAVLLTLQLLWGAFAQVALIYLAWIYLKIGRLDLHNIIPLQPKAISADNA